MEHKRELNRLRQKAYKERKRASRLTCQRVADVDQVESQLKQVVPIGITALYDLARADRPSMSGQDYQSLFHVIAHGHEALEYMFAGNWTILGWCRCKESTMEDAEPKHLHFHLLVKAPSGYVHGKMAGKLLDMYKPKEDVDGVKVCHAKELAIHCEKHLMAVAHYVSCLKSSVKKKYTDVQHHHFDCHGPMGKHTVKECDKLTADATKAVDVQHNFKECGCFLGEKALEKKSAKQRHRADLVQLWHKEVENGTCTTTLQDFLEDKYSINSHHKKRKVGDVQERVNQQIAVSEELDKDYQ